ncbi:site-specific DNA-methyltransferase, partial [Phascolarctobacterium succinatutens]
MMEHLNMQSMDKVAANVAKIRELFPNCVTERINNEGKLEHAIDFDMLKQELSDHVVDGLQERYQFTWPDKRKAILAANAPINKTLRPCREESVDFDNTENLYIEGDNLEVLKLLRETYLRSIDVIYIDPPYNTGNNLIYRNNYYQDAEDYLISSEQLDDYGNHMVYNLLTNGRYHTDWLNMLYSRLKVSKDLLSDRGILVLTIDDNEIETTTMLLNEIFGEENHLATIIIKNNPSGRSTLTGVSIAHEYALFYGANPSVKLGRLPRNDKQIARYKEIDQYGQYE